VFGAYVTSLPTRRFFAASIERNVWEYSRVRPSKKESICLRLLTDVLKRDIEINEALK
jgi:hypothetical protein